MDEVYKLLPSLIPVIIGGLIVWIGTLIADRRKLSTEKRANLRASYAKWFTSERILKSQIEEVINLLRPSNDLEQIDVLISETKKIPETIKEVLQTSHEILLLDAHSKRCELIIGIVNILDRVNKLAIESINNHKQVLVMEDMLSEKLPELNKHSEVHKTLKGSLPLMNKLKKIPEISEKPELKKELQRLSFEINNLEDFEATLQKLQEDVKIRREVQSKEMSEFRSEMLTGIHSIHQIAEFILKDLGGKL